MQRSAAVRVMPTISKRSWSSWARRGAASRQTAITARTWPPEMRGTYSRMTALVSRVPSAPAWAGVVMAAMACWPSRAERKSSVTAAWVPTPAPRVAGEHRAVGQQHRHRHQLATPDQELEGRLEVGLVRRARGGRIEERRREVDGHEGPDGRGVGADRSAEERLLLVVRHQRRLAARGDAHDQQEGPQDEHEQRRSSHAADRRVLPGLDG